MFQRTSSVDFLTSFKSVLISPIWWPRFETLAEMTFNSPIRAENLDSVRASTASNLIDKNRSSTKGVDWDEADIEGCEGVEAVMYGPPRLVFVPWDGTVSTVIFAAQPAAQPPTA
jgi:hypothetical protein